MRASRGSGWKSRMQRPVVAAARRRLPPPCRGGHIGRRHPHQHVLASCPELLVLEGQGCLHGGSGQHGRGRPSCLSSRPLSSVLIDACPPSSCSSWQPRPDLSWTPPGAQHDGGPRAAATEPPPAAPGGRRPPCAARRRFRAHSRRQVRRTPPARPPARPPLPGTEGRPPAASALLAHCGGCTRHIPFRLTISTA